MRHALVLTIAAALAAQAGDLKPLPGQAGNDDIELVGSVIVAQDEIQQELGADLGKGYIVVRMKATPKTDHPLRIGPDDFTAISHKDGQRSQALEPTQIAGTGGALIVREASSGGSRTGTDIGIFGGAIGTSPGTTYSPLDSRISKGDPKAKDSPLLTALKAKVLPDKETKEPVEGLLYFPIEGKIKPKDLAVIYQGPAGKLVMEFESLKKR
jgi:hypothetical protein